MEQKKELGVDINTVRAVDMLVGFFTQDQRELLAIRLNGQVVTLFEQFLGRWWDYVPVTNIPLAFRAEAAKILETNKGWLQLLEKLKQDDLFSKLLDPENYKERQHKSTLFKGIDRRQLDSDSQSANLARSIARSAGGEGGVNKAYDYSGEWDRSDRERLDKAKIEKEQAPLVSTETGQEDDALAIQPGKEVPWMQKPERLDSTQARRNQSRNLRVKFSDAHEEIGEKRLDLFDVNLTHNSSTAATESVTGSNTFIEGLRRQNYETINERIVMAEAINNLNNVDFMDVREKLYRRLDPLFMPRSKSCPY